MNGTHALRLLSVSFVAFFLVGCASDPLTELPINQKIQMMAEQQHSNQANNGAQGISVRQLIAQARAKNHQENYKTKNLGPDVGHR